MSSTINITLYHVPEERVAPPPKPSVVIPYSRNAHFIERSAASYEIYQRCTKPGSQAALVGLSGVGKSQLAIECAFRIHEDLPNTWVFWVTASNAARFEQSFRDIADYVEIPGRRNPKNNIFELVHCWLRESKEPWTLIFDDLDHASLLNAYANSKFHSADDLEMGIIRPWRRDPRCKRGSVLFITREKREALKMVQLCDIVCVEPMDKAQALLLFEQTLGTQVNRDDVTGLATALGYIPLAIVQAAAHISQRTYGYSGRHYLEEIRTGVFELGISHGTKRRDQKWRVKSCLIKTWKISFDYIRKIQPSAANLLSFMSFFDRREIPEALLQSHEDQSKKKDPKNGEYGSPESKTGKDKLRHDLALLRDYCLISVNTDGTTFEMHAFVQLMTRKWLQANNEFDRWNHRFVYHLNANFPTGEYENWQVCQMLFSHVIAAAYQRPVEDCSFTEWATLMYHAAWYALSKGSAADAEKLAIKSIRARKVALGKTHRDTLSSMEILGLAYSLGGRWGAAEELQRQVMETRKSILGEKHPETLISMNNLAFTLNERAHLGKAISLMERCCQLREAVLGPRHSYTISSMEALGVWRLRSVQSGL